VSPDPFRSFGKGSGFDACGGRGEGMLTQEVARGTLISDTMGGMNTGGWIEILREGGSDDTRLGMKGSLRAMSWRTGSMVNDSGSGSRSATVGVSMIIGWSAVSSARFDFFEGFFEYQLVLRLFFWYGAVEERGTGAESEFSLLKQVEDCNGSLPDWKHAADMEVSFIGSSTTWVRAAAKFVGSQSKEPTRKPRS